MSELTTTTAAELLIANLTEGKTKIDKDRDGWRAETEFLSATGIDSWEVTTSKDGSGRLYTSCWEMDITFDGKWRSSKCNVHDARNFYYRGTEKVVVNQRTITAYHNASLAKFRQVLASELPPKANHDDND